jgi:hypothetical protein
MCKFIFEPPAIIKSFCIIPIWLIFCCRENFFKEAGEVADVRFALDADQRFKGFGHVEFTTTEAAQKVTFFFYFLF